MNQHQDNSHLFEVDDEDDDWIPLNPSTSYANEESNLDNSNSGTFAHHYNYHSTANTSGTSPERNARTGPTASSRTPKPAAATSRGSDHTNLDRDMQRIRNHHERNSSLKRHLINQPITRFPYYFLKNLASEVWASHYYIRLGMFLIFCGICTQVFSFTILCYTSMNKIMKLFVTVVVIGFASSFYLQNTIYDLRSRLRIPQTVSDAVLTCLENADGKNIRRCVIGVIYVLPVMMEMMVLVFLSKLVGEAFERWWVKSVFCCFAVGIEAVIVLPMHFNAIMVDKNEKGARTDGIREGSIFRMKGMALVKMPFTTFFDCRLHLWAFLYTMALMTTTFMVKENQAYKPMLLAGPFLLVSGALLVLSTTEGEEGERLIMNLVRRVLRRTLGGILKELGEEVSEDEMLQLLMLRWIVDYWASSTSKDNSSFDTDKRKNKRSVAGVSNSTSSSHGGPDTSNENMSGHENTMPSTKAYARETPQNRSEGGCLGWEELFSMLSLTTDQMYKEVDSDREDGRSTNRQEQPYKNESLRTLQAMLQSFNANERAKPAVMSYKVAVEELPPSRAVAIYVSVARRCPAVLSAIYLFVFDPAHANPCIIMLLPLMILDAMKISEWITACQKFGESQLHRSEMHTSAKHEFERSNWLMDAVPVTMAPMEILLSEDHYSPYQRRTALCVWNNVQSSVRALDLGLTAMKCAQTAQVATNLTFNVISLASFAAEMRNEGLGVGLKVLLVDLFHFHLEKVSPTSQQDDNRSQYRSKYAHAALDFVENSQMLQRNVHELLEEGNNNTIFSPVISIIQGIFGEKGKESDPAPEDINGKAETENNGHIRNNEKKECSKTEDANNMVNENVNTPSVPEDLELEDHDGSWTEIDTQLNRNPSIDRASTSDRDEATDEKTPAIPITETHHAIIEEEPSDHLKWIGAGVALIGTVIGGIALANNSKNSSHEGDKEKQSTVTIERLDDDEE